MDGGLLRKSCPVVVTAKSGREDEMGENGNNEEVI